MSMKSRGISDIQTKDRRKSAAPKKKDSVKARVSVGSMGAPPSGLPQGVVGYKKGGAIDGCASKGHTKGKML